MRRRIWIATSITIGILVAGGLLGWGDRAQPPRGGAIAGPTDARHALESAAGTWRSASTRMKPTLARLELSLLDSRLRARPMLARLELSLLDARLRTRPALERAWAALSRGDERSTQALGTLAIDDRAVLGALALLAIAIVAWVARRLRRRSARATALDLARRGRSTADIARRLGVAQDGVRALMRPADGEAEVSGRIFRRAGSSDRRGAETPRTRGWNRMRRA